MMASLWSGLSPPVAMVPSLPQVSLHPFQAKEMQLQAWELRPPILLRKLLKFRAKRKSHGRNCQLCFALLCFPKAYAMLDLIPLLLPVFSLLALQSVMVESPDCPGPSAEKNTCPSG